MKKLFCFAVCAAIVFSMQIHVCASQISLNNSQKKLEQKYTISEYDIDAVKNTTDFDKLETYISEIKDEFPAARINVNDLLETEARIRKMSNQDKAKYIEVLFDTPIQTHKTIQNDGSYEIVEIYEGGARKRSFSAGSQTVIVGGVSYVGSCVSEENVIGVTGLRIAFKLDHVLVSGKGTISRVYSATSTIVNGYLNLTSYRFIRSAPVNMSSWAYLRATLEAWQLTVPPEPDRGWLPIANYRLSFNATSFAVDFTLM